MSRAVCYIFGVKKELVGKESACVFKILCCILCTIFASLRPDFRLEYSCSCISLIEDIYMYQCCCMQQKGFSVGYICFSLKAISVRPQRKLGVFVL